MKKQLTFLAILVCMAVMSFANNVSVSSVSLSGQNPASHYTLINYDITWENSWRTNTNENNYDGCWIFAKFRKINSNNWQHATINYAAPGNAAACGHTQPGGSTIQTAADGKGIWMYRSANGQGTVSWSGAKLRWNYGVDGVADNDSVEIRLFAIEMVYCPQGAFNLGSGGGEIYHFRDGAVDTYYPITSEAAINCGPVAGQLYTAGGNYWITGTLPAAYPKGYKAVWCMKYEISQQQYADFLNTIDYAKYTNRNTYNSYNISGTHPNLTPDYPERAINYISTEDLLSILDWSALRPMTEMEYEKICRGANQVPVANEYAWGNTTIDQVSTPSNQGMIDETWLSGNCNYSTVVGAMIRCGALATYSSNRQTSGATYYGVMEMSGNNWEAVITGGNAFGRSFTGAHGDGNLDPNGLYNAANWSVNGIGYRGGGYADNVVTSCRISDRYQSASGPVLKNNVMTGGRGIRTAE